MTNNTHEAVVLAAYGFGGARAAGADAYDGEGRAGEANGGGHIAENNAKEAQECRGTRRAGLNRNILDSDDRI